MTLIADACIQERDTVARDDASVQLFVIQAFLLRRLFTLLPVVLLVAVLTFVMMRLLPGDPILAMMGGERGLDQTTYRQLRTQYGFEQPLPVQFATWLANTARGDLGQSFRTRTGVTDNLLGRLPVTLELVRPRF